MSRRDGFPGQRMRVVPTQGRPEEAAAHLMVTDCGFFPRAQDHHRRRARGCAETVVMICADGRGWLRLPAGRFDVEGGHLMILPAGISHEYGADAPAPWSLWWMHVTGSAMPDLLAHTGVSAERPVVLLRDPHRLVSLVDEALRHLEHGPTPAHVRAAAGAAWHLLSLVALEHRAGSHRTDPVALAQQLLRDRLPARTSVDELAGLVGLSPSHLAALFKRATGHGILQYQTRYLMALACELLTSTDRSIATVARDVGYADPYYFSRQFHKVHGMGPRDFRRAAQQ